MMHARMIRADGMDWPLDTFVDAYRFHRTDGQPLALEGRLDVVTKDGTLQCGRYASDVEWSRVIAAKPEPGSMSMTECDGCGALVAMRVTNSMPFTLEWHCDECAANPY